MHPSTLARVIHERRGGAGSSPPPQGIPLEPEVTNVPTHSYPPPVVRMATTATSDNALALSSGECVVNSHKFTLEEAELKNVMAIIAAAFVRHMQEEADKIANLQLSNIRALMPAPREPEQEVVRPPQRNMAQIQAQIEGEIPTEELSSLRASGAI